MKKIISLLLIIALVLCLPACSEKKSTATEFALDTVVTLTAYGKEADEAISAAIDEVKRLELLLSAHTKASEIAKINSDAYKAPVKVSEETARVLKRALEISYLTDGAFDITIKPLVDLWNVKAENPSLPSEAEIAEAKDRVGYEALIIDGSFVSFKKEGMAIDLGAAAKGYIADRVVEIFKSHGIKNALIDLGGNIYAMGKSDKGTKWRIGLQHPGKERGEYFTIEELSDRSVVTSGSYERYFENGGKIYHHIIDPKTGYPADNALISVSVIGESSFEADMLSTAIFVMGSPAFNEIAESFDYDKFITVDKNNYSRTYTKEN